MIKITSFICMIFLVSILSIRTSFCSEEISIIVNEKNPISELSEDHFIQTSSIIHRLRLVMTVIALFTIFGAFALYLSSISTLKGLQELKSSNDLLTLSSQIVESLTSTERSIDKITSSRDVTSLE